MSADGRGRLIEKLTTLAKISKFSARDPSRFHRTLIPISQERARQWASAIVNRLTDGDFWLLLYLSRSLPRRRRVFNSRFRLAGPLCPAAVFFPFFLFFPSVFVFAFAPDPLRLAAGAVLFRSAIFMHGHLAGKFVGRWNISFVPRGATGGSRLFCHRAAPAMLSRYAKISLIRVARGSPLPFPAFSARLEKPCPLALRRVFLREESAFQLTRAAPIRYSFVFAINTCSFADASRFRGSARALKLQSWLSSLECWNFTVILYIENGEMQAKFVKVGPQQRKNP